MTLKVEDLNIEISLEGGEIIGRWSLYDVQARRLIASVFELDLAGEEVTFLADDPIDFAYRGVDHMAETWAQLKAKNVVRRALAVRRSRRLTLPSRIGELTGAMTETVREFTTVVPSAKPVSPAGVTAVAPASEGADEPEDPARARALEEERRRIEAERRRLEEERRKLEEERRKAEEVLEKLRAEVEPEPSEPEPEPSEPAPNPSEPAPEPPEPAPELVSEPEPEQPPSVPEAKGVVVDLNHLEEAEPEPEPAMAGAVADRPGGLMGAVRAAFTRSSRTHVHSFDEAPGGIGIVRKICVECGYVSITTED